MRHPYAIAPSAVVTPPGDLDNLLNLNGCVTMLWHNFSLGTAKGRALYLAVLGHT